MYTALGRVYTISRFSLSRASFERMQAPVHIEQTYYIAGVHIGSLTLLSRTVHSTDRE